MNSEEWISTFEPYQNKYSIKVKIKDSLYNGEFSFQWITKESYLDLGTIEKALQGKTEIGFFNTYQTRVIGIDIDDHTNIGLSRKVLFTYENLLKRIGHYPNLLFKSKRGLHLYYFFEYKSLHELFDFWLNKKLSGLKTEILPSPSHSLRIDSLESCLNPKTLESTEFNTNIERYFPCEIFNKDLVKSELKSTKQKRIRNFYEFDKSNKIEELETSILPITQGYSNEAYLKIIPIYYHAGLDQYEAYKRFQHLLWISNYNGDLVKNTRILESKIRSSYRTFNRNKDKFYFIGNPNQNLELFDMEWINYLIIKNPFSNQRKKKLKEFLIKLVCWLNYHDNMVKSEFEFWCWYYPMYRVNRRIGLYPIPSVYFRSKLFRYNDIFSWLVDIGHAKIETNYHFDLEYPDQNFCRYYSFKRLYDTAVNPEIEFLQILRDLSKQYSQSEIGRVLGVSKMTISRYLRGLRKPSNSDLEIYLEKLSKFPEKPIEVEKEVDPFIQALQSLKVTRTAQIT